MGLLSQAKHTSDTHLLKILVLLAIFTEFLALESTFSDQTLGERFFMIATTFNSVAHSRTIEPLLKTSHPLFRGFILICRNVKICWMSHSEREYTRSPHIQSIQFLQITFVSPKNHPVYAGCPVDFLPHPFHQTAFILILIFKVLNKEVTAFLQRKVLQILKIPNFQNILSKHRFFWGSHTIKFTNLLIISKNRLNCKNSTCSKKWLKRGQNYQTISLSSR